MRITKHRHRCCPSAPPSFLPIQSYAPPALLFSCAVLACVLLALFGYEYNYMPLYPLAAPSPCSAALMVGFCSSSLPRFSWFALASICTGFPPVGFSDIGSPRVHVDNCLSILFLSQNNSFGQLVHAQGRCFAVSASYLPHCFSASVPLKVLFR